MERKEFLALLSAGTATMLLGSCLGGCSGKKEDDPKPTNTGPGTGTGTGGTGSNKKDFTIDLNQTTSLKTKGNAVVSNGVIVAYTNAGNYIAVAAACTHEGYTINYNASGSHFSCSNHGSTFSESGAVTNGPASTALKQYSTTLSGNSLRVFEP